MKILVIGHSASYTGASKFTLNFVKFLVATNKDSVSVIINTNGPLFEDYAAVAKTYLWDAQHQGYSLAGKFKYVLQRVLGASAESIQSQRLRKYHAKLKETIGDFEAVFCNTSANGDILSYLDLNGKKVVTRLPEMSFNLLNNYRESASVTFSSSSHIVAVSQAVKNDLISSFEYPEANIEVIYGNVPVIDPETYPKGMLKKTYDIEQEALIVGGCGITNWRKGIDLFIQVAHLVICMTNKKVVFCWIGGASNKRFGAQLEYDILKYGLKGKVIITGFVPEPIPYLADYDIFLMTSREDPFPLVNMEAGQFSIPIVGFKETGGTSELIDYENGLAEYGDVEDMANKVLNYVEDPSLRVADGQKLFANVKSKPALTHVQERIYALLTDG